MDADNASSIETEEKKQGETETRPVPPVWVSAPSPDVKPEEKQVTPIQQERNVAPVESPSPYSSELSFACILLPRFSDHYLAGDVADFLPEWMKQVCISYGWRLEAIAVRPGYLQWVMKVPLNANPAHFMKLIRRYTSEKIFEDFPRFRQKNVSAEF